MRGNVNGDGKVKETPQADQHIRQRNRIPKSCVACLKGKRSCDRDKPACSRCRDKKQDCVYKTIPFEKPRLARGTKQSSSQGQSMEKDQEQPAASTLLPFSLSSHCSDTSIDERLVETGEHACQGAAIGESDANSNKNRNGQPAWYGSATRPLEFHKECSRVQSALNGLLDPVADVHFQDDSPSTSNIAEFRRNALQLLSPPRKMARYFDEVRHYLRPALPALLDDAFLRTAEELVLESDSGKQEKISLPWLAVLLMMAGLGLELTANSHNDEGITDERQMWLASSMKRDYVQSDAYLTATHKALCLASFHSSPNLQTIYAQLILGLYLIHTERAATFWPLLGSVARQAQAIGLHVEPTRNSTDSDLRRRIWWAIVQQDVLLSSIFGRPLAVTNFTCQISAPENRTSQPSCLETQAQYVMLQRRHLTENMFQEWNDTQLDQFRKDLLQWYSRLPLSVQISPEDDGRIREESLLAQLSDKPVGAIEATVDSFIKVQYTILSLYRNRLQSKHNGIRQESQRFCGDAIHNMGSGFSVMVNLLGILQVGNLWLRIFYAFHSGVTAAFIALTLAGSSKAQEAKEEFTNLTALCRRLPQRFEGLKTVNATFAVLLQRVEELHQQQNGQSLFPLQPGSNTYRSDAISSKSDEKVGCTPWDASPACPSLVTATSSSNLSTSMDTDFHSGQLSQPEQSFSVDAFDMDKIDISNWTGNFPDPFGLPNGALGLETSDEEIQSFWNQFFSMRSQSDDLDFG